MDPSEEENLDSIHFIWDITPNSKVQQARSAIHPAFHYTPYSPLPRANDRSLEYTPLTCNCEAVFNKFCPVDFNLKSIRCCFCQAVSPLPPEYAKVISPQKLPYELMPANSTFQFHFEPKNSNHAQRTNLPATSAHCLLFVLDLCLPEKELDAIKQKLV
jgi:hypothetical protein